MRLLPEAYLYKKAYCSLLEERPNLALNTIPYSRGAAALELQRSKIIFSNQKIALYGVVFYVGVVMILS